LKISAIVMLFTLIVILSAFFSFLVVGLAAIIGAGSWVVFLSSFTGITLLLAVQAPSAYHKVVGVLEDKGSAN
jgi:hypothetical protein